ncbi:MAG: GntR family transcriptional regulator [Rhodobacterales bacterium]|nr:GntR family transcriptional regulator [Rhodobacterales bacterium]MDX5390361.1 GntR family transcriptional regulator [Rhodobacterales bacterium]
MLGDRLRNKIADLILAGELRPGDRLDETALAQRFGVSRTPVREALQQLGTSGLVENRPRRSAIVRKLSMGELAAFFEATGEIEALCTRYSAERMTQAERIALKELIDLSKSASDAGDRVASRALDEQFHEMLHDGAHNPALRDMARGMRMRVGPYSAAPYTLETFDTLLTVPHFQHAAIVQAILDRDAEAAHRHMLDHIGHTFLVIRDILTVSGKNEEALRTATNDVA